MNNIEDDRKKLEKVGRRAMNIQMIEAVMKTVNTDGNPVDGTEHRTIFLYNLEKIARSEVERLLNNGEYVFDSRILQTDPETFANIFPHAGDAKKDGVTAYWKPCDHNNDFINCRCSKCGFMTRAIDAVDIGENSTDYVGIKYRFCPKCGSPMSHK